MSNKPENPRNPKSAPNPQTEPETKSEGEQKPQKDAKKGEINPFWLATVFPDPVAVFQFDSPTPDELKADGVFALDTNVLLAPYELGQHSFQDIEKIYRGLAKNNRLFVPAQAAREYAKNRGKKISEVYHAVHERLSALPATGDLTCPILEGVPEYENVKKIIGQVRAETKGLRDALGQLKEALTNWGWKDKVSSLYREVFTQERITDHSVQKDQVLMDLMFRSTHSTPPSYKDSAKLDGGIGDLLIWLSLKALAKAKKRSVIFVCNDEKADWSICSAGDAVLPRSELAISTVTVSSLPLRAGAAPHPGGAGRSWSCGTRNRCAPLPYAAVRD